MPLARSDLAHCCWVAIVPSRSWRSDAAGMSSRGISLDGTRKRGTKAPGPQERGTRRTRLRGGRRRRARCRVRAAAPRAEPAFGAEAERRSEAAEALADVAHLADVADQL